MRTARQSANLRGCNGIVDETRRFHSDSRGQREPVGNQERIDGQVGRLVLEVRIALASSTMSTMLVIMESYKRGLLPSAAALYSVHPCGHVGYDFV
jgi:hypothetical protein